MTNVVKKHSISYELAQKMVDKALAKARELRVTENVAILDDGGHLKAFGRMDGAPILCRLNNKRATKMIHTHQTAPTQFVEANGIRFAYRRFGKAGGVPLVFSQHYIGTMDYWDPT